MRGSKEIEMKKSEKKNREKENGLEERQKR